MASVYASKQELVNWVNGALGLRLARLEQVISRLTPQGACKQHDCGTWRCSRAPSMSKMSLFWVWRGDGPYRRITLSNDACTAPFPVQFGNGAAFCQVLDAFYPTAIPMHKVGLSRGLRGLQRFGVFQPMPAGQRGGLMLHVRICSVASASPVGLAAQPVD